MTVNPSLSGAHMVFHVIFAVNISRVEESRLSDFHRRDLRKSCINQL